MAAFIAEPAALVPGLTGATLAWGDCDNDGDLDFAIAGRDASYVRSSSIYRNDGGGVFTNSGASLVGVDLGSLAWGDYDNDGDLDLALTGYGNDGLAKGKIYRNDGGVFVDTNASIWGAFESSIAWGDYDKDGDLDLAIAGRDGYG